MYVPHRKPQIERARVLRSINEEIARAIGSTAPMWRDDAAPREPLKIMSRHHVRCRCRRPSIVAPLVVSIASR